jgi:hypothetical protein
LFVAIATTTADSITTSEAWKQVFANFSTNSITAEVVAGAPHTRLVAAAVVFGR